MRSAVHTRATLMLVLATAAWGLSFPGGKALMAALEMELPGRSSWCYSSLVMGARFALGALILFLFRPMTFARAQPGEWRQGIGLGASGGMGMLFQADGLAHTAASTSAFLTQFAAVLVPIAVAFRDRRVPPVWTILCVLIVMAGCGVLAQFDFRELRLGRGELETLIGTAFFTAQILFLERPIFRGNNSGRVTLIMFATISLLIFPVFLYHSQGVGDAAALVSSGNIFVLFVALTLICSVAAFLLMNRWQPEVDATTAGIVYCAEPLFATGFALFLPALLGPLLGILYANEVATPHLLIGGGLITLANILISLKPLAPASPTLREPAS